MINYICTNSVKNFFNKTDLFHKQNSLSTLRCEVKPFLKWAGGKKQLLQNISLYYPFNTYINKYIEPFVGGGAVLFDILNQYNLEYIYISDINAELINVYSTIRNNLNELLELLLLYQTEYLPLDIEHRKIYYGNKRLLFNDLKINGTRINNIEKAALMIFLNKTCFNGLYRENKSGLFNVPIGAYKRPVICDEENLRAVSYKLRNVDIVHANYTESFDHMDEHTFIYIDPPYRPLNTTSNFTSYTKNSFDDTEQIKLAKFVDKINDKGAKFLLSNSDPKNADINDNFFDDLYSKYNIKRVGASRMINSNSKARGKITELLISNF